MEAVRIFVAGVSVSVQKIRDEVSLVYDRTGLDEAQRHAFYEALGTHCLAEIGVIGGTTSTIVTDFSDIQFAVAALAPRQS